MKLIILLGQALLDLAEKGQGRLHSRAEFFESAVFLFLGPAGFYQCVVPALQFLRFPQELRLEIFLARSLFDKEFFVMQNFFGFPFPVGTDRRQLRFLGFQN